METINTFDVKEIPVEPEGMLHQLYCALCERDFDSIADLVLESNVLNDGETYEIEIEDVPMRLKDHTINSFMVRFFNLEGEITRQLLISYYDLAQLMITHAKEVVAFWLETSSIEVESSIIV